MKALLGCSLRAACLALPRSAEPTWPPYRRARPAATRPQVKAKRQRNFRLADAIQLELRKRNIEPAKRVLSVFIALPA